MGSEMKNIEGIILAAGYSSRMERFKPLLPFRDGTIISNAIDAMRDSVDRIFVVGGYNVDLLREALKDCEIAEIVENKAFRDGMFSSIRKGLMHISADRFFLMPCDYPLVNADIYQRLAKIDADLVLPEFNGRTGHPVLISANFIPQILAMPQSATLRDFIYNTEAVQVDVGCDSIFFDIDFIEDYDRLLSRKFDDD